MRRWTFQLISQTRFHRTSTQRSIISESTRPTSRLTLCSSTSNTSTTTGSRRRLQLFSIIQAFRNNLVDASELRLNFIKICKGILPTMNWKTSETQIFLERLNKTQTRTQFNFHIRFYLNRILLRLYKFRNKLLSILIRPKRKKTFEKPNFTAKQFSRFLFPVFGRNLFTNKKFFLFLGVATLEKCTNSQWEGKASLYGVEHFSAHFEYCPWMLWKIKFSHF